MADGFQGYDAWKAAEPAPTERDDAPDPHEDCERLVEAQAAEIARLRKTLEALQAALDTKRGA